jgi:hypothetical protein
MKALLTALMLCNAALFVFGAFAARRRYDRVIRWVRKIRDLRAARHLWAH